MTNPECTQRSFQSDFRTFSVKSGGFIYIWNSHTQPQLLFMFASMSVIWYIQTIVLCCANRNCLLMVICVIITSFWLKTAKQCVTTLTFNMLLLPKISSPDQTESALNQNSQIWCSQRIWYRYRFVSLTLNYIRKKKPTSKSIAINSHPVQYSI